jgi:MFS family permease
VGGIFLSPTLPVVYVMTALHSVAAAFFQPAKAAALPLTVSRDDLPRANAWDQSASSLMLVAGPVLGAELLTRFGLGATLLLDALSFLASAALVAGAGIAGGGGARAPLALRGVLADVGAGWRYVRGHALALHLYLLFFVSLLCTSLWMPLAPFFVRDYLHAPERVLGWQFAAFGAGAVAGGLWAPQPVSRFGKGATLFAALVAEGSCLTLYALVPHAGLSVALMVAWGFMVSLIVVPFYSILQAVVDEGFAGRVFSLVKQSENVAIVLAMGLAALLQDRIASHAILLLAGLLYLLLAATSSLTGGGRRLLATR